LNIRNLGYTFQKKLGELIIHPRALYIQIYCGKIEARSEQFAPLPIPIIELLQGFPLSFVVTYEFWIGHDGIPIIFDADSVNICFFEIIKDLDYLGFTNLMILMPTFRKVMVVNGALWELISYSACSALKIF
jgi:hypothetical protein